MIYQQGNRRPERIPRRASVDLIRPRSRSPCADLQRTAHVVFPLMKPRNLVRLERRRIRQDVLQGARKGRLSTACRSRVLPEDPLAGRAAVTGMNPCSVDRCVQVRWCRPVIRQMRQQLAGAEAAPTAWLTIRNVIALGLASLDYHRRASLTKRQLPKRARIRRALAVVLKRPGRGGFQNEEGIAAPKCAGTDASADRHGNVLCARAITPIPWRAPSVSEGEGVETQLRSRNEWAANEAKSTFSARIRRDSSARELPLAPHLIAADHQQARHLYSWS